MNKKTKKNIYIGAIVVGVIAVVWVFFLNSSGGGGGFNVYKKQVTCTVLVTNPLLTYNSLELSNAICTSKQVLACNPFSILSTSGELTLSSAGITGSPTSVSVSSIPGYNSAVYSVSVCGMNMETTSGQIQVTIDNNQISDTLEVSFP